LTDDYIFPDNLDASVTYDWFVKAELAIQDAQMPEPIREYVLEHIRGAKHYCTKWDVVHPWGFGLDEHWLAYKLIGPHPWMIEAQFVD